MPKLYRVVTERVMTGSCEGCPNTIFHDDGDRYETLQWIKCRVCPRPERENIVGTWRTNGYPSVWSGIPSWCPLPDLPTPEKELDTDPLTAHNTK